MQKKRVTIPQEGRFQVDSSFQACYEMNMKQFLRGSVPVLVIGANPGGIVIAKGLIDAGIPVTLLGEGRPLGGVGALLTNGPRQVPAWPPAYEGYAPAEWADLSLMLSQAHAKGVCLQPEERLRHVTVEGTRIMEVTTEGVLGKVNRRPRAVVLASRLDHFIEKIGPDQGILTPKQLSALTCETDAVVHMRWSGGPPPNLRPTFQESGPWKFMNCSPVGRKRPSYSWTAFTSTVPPGAVPSAEVQTDFLNALFGKGDPQEIGLQDWAIETRFVKDVRPGKVSSTVLKRMDKGLGSLENLVRVGPLATFQKTTMREEVAQATDLVQSWLEG